MATKGLKSLVKKISKNSEGSVIIGEGMDRVKGAADVLKKNGVENISVFEPSSKAMKEWNKLTEGGSVKLSDKALKATKLYKENKVWIKNAKKSGKTVIDIGEDARKNKSKFYNMEKETVYD